MEEKRRSKRLPIELELVVSKLFKQEELADVDVNDPIQVTDVSRLGIGFVTSNNFPLNYYFNAKLELGSPDNSLYCVVQIIRKTQKEDNLYSYGCEFIGLAPVLEVIFEEYEKTLA